MIKLETHTDLNTDHFIMRVTIRVPHEMVMECDQGLIATISSYNTDIPSRIAGVALLARMLAERPKKSATEILKLEEPR